ncbi:hypothetical protein EES47_20920 [Streptomyces sp. ADI98-12]|nr:hypothetical protein EES47_20920 [Streptomyces sp. ADI98-12]
MATVDLVRPERDGGHLLDQDLLGLLVELDGLLQRLGVVALLEQVVDLLVGESTVVRLGRGAVQLTHEVDVQRVVGDPATAVERLDLVVVARLEVGGEVGLGVAEALDPGGVADGLADRGHPLLVPTVGVVLDEDLVVRHTTAFLDELLRLVRVVVEHLGVEVLVALDLRRGEALRRLAGVVEDGLGDRLAVDRHRQALHDLGVDVLPLLRVEGGDDRLDGRVLLLDGAVTEVGLVLRQVLRADLADHVQVAGEDVLVGGLDGGVVLELDALVLGLVRTGVVRVGLDLDELAVRPLLERVRAVADRLLAERLRVVEEDLGQRGPGGVAELVLEVRDRLVELDGEGGVVHGLQAGHLLGLGLGALTVGVDVLVALDVLEPERVLHLVLDVRGPVPRIDVGLGGDGGAVVELPALLQLHRPGLRVLGLDRLGVGVDDVALGVEVQELGEERLDDVRAEGLVGVGRDQGLLRLADVDRDVAGGLARRLRLVATVVVATAGGRGQGDDYRTRDPLGALGTTHGFLLMSPLVHCERGHRTIRRHP